MNDEVKVFYECQFCFHKTTPIWTRKEGFNCVIGYCALCGHLVEVIPDRKS